MTTSTITLILTALWLLIATHLAEREVIRDRQAGWEAVIRALTWPLQLIGSLNNTIQSTLDRIKLTRLKTQETTQPSRATPINTPTDSRKDTP